MLETTKTGFLVNEAHMGIVPISQELVLGIGQEITIDYRNTLAD